MLDLEDQPHDVAGVSLVDLRRQEDVTWLQVRPACW
jgi:hypothetical protein